MFNRTLKDTAGSFFIPSGLPVPEQISNGNILRNINSYEYLGYIALNITKELMEFIPSFFEMFNLYQKHPAYLPEYAYGNLYTKFLLDCEKHISFIIQKKQEYDTLLEKLHQSVPDEKHSINCQITLEMTRNKKQSLIQMLHYIYANPNEALERSYAMIAAVIALSSKNGSKIEHLVTKRLDEKAGGPNNHTTPQSEGSVLGRLSASLSRDYKPLTTTSIPSIRVYQHQQTGLSPIEYRFGTQGQINLGKAEVNPIFSIWLDLQKNLSEPNRITHIYFNNLTLTSPDLSMKRECELSFALHALNIPNLAVITLPAYMSLMNTKTLINYNLAMGHDYLTAKNKMLQVATGVDGKPIEDFYINNNLKSQLYGPGDPYDKEMEQHILVKLLENSFKIMGARHLKKISLSQQQAVFFHFIKFELVNFILERLQPDSFNMSCKDAIDRGGVSSAYYNLLKSLEKGVPMSLPEFLCALHGAPTLVKGRGMNFHINIIWNAIDHLIQAYDKDTIKTGLLPSVELPNWLRTWRDENALPHSKTKYTQKLTQYIQQRSNQTAYFSIFGEFNKMDLLIKMAAAKKLLLLLEGDQQTSFSIKELATLKDGRLGKLFHGITTDQLLIQPEVSTLDPENDSAGVDVKQPM